MNKKESYIDGGKCHKCGHVLYVDEGKFKKHPPKICPSCGVNLSGQFVYSRGKPGIRQALLEAFPFLRSGDQYE